MPSGIPGGGHTENLRRRLPPLVPRPQPDTGPPWRSQRSLPHFVPLSRFAWSPAGEPGPLRNRVDGPLPAACWESCRTGLPIRRLNSSARVPGGQPVRGPASRSGPSWRDCPAPSAGTQRRGIAAIAVTGPAAAEPGSPGDEPGPGMTPGPDRLDHGYPGRSPARYRPVTPEHEPGCTERPIMSGPEGRRAELHSCTYRRLGEPGSRFATHEDRVGCDPAGSMGRRNAAVR